MVLIDPEKRQMQIMMNMKKTITTMIGEGRSDINGFTVIERMTKDAMLAFHPPGSRRFKQLQTMAVNELAHRARERLKHSPVNWQPPTRPEQPGQYRDNRDDRYIDCDPTATPEAIGFSEDDLMWRR